MEKNQADQTQKQDQQHNIQDTLTVRQSLIELNHWFDRHYRLIILITAIITLCSALCAAWAGLN